MIPQKNRHPNIKWLGKSGSFPKTCLSSWKRRPDLKWPVKEIFLHCLRLHVSWIDLNKWNHVLHLFQRLMYRSFNPTGVYVVFVVWSRIVTCVAERQWSDKLSLTMHFDNCAIVTLWHCDIVTFLLNLQRTFDSSVVHNVMAQDYLQKWYFSLWPFLRLPLSRKVLQIVWKPVGWPWPWSMTQPTTEVGRWSRVV